MGLSDIQIESVKSTLAKTLDEIETSLGEYPISCLVMIGDHWYEWTGEKFIFNPHTDKFLNDEVNYEEH